MPSINDLKLTPAQQKKFDELYDAHQACLKVGIKFVSFDDFMYPLNGKKIKRIDPNGIIPVTDPEKQFKFCTMPSGWDSVNIDEPYVQCTVTATLK